MKVFLSSIAKNDIKMLMRVFNAEEKNKDKYFLDELRKSVSEILNESEKLDIKSREMQVYESEKFPFHVHYIFEDNESLFITAVFRNS